MSATVETLLAERLEDLRNDDDGGLGFRREGCKAAAGNVRAAVDYLLDLAYSALWHNEHEQADIIAAGGHVDAALNLLTTYRERLDRLYELDSDEAMAAEGWTKVRRGTYRPPEGEAQATA